jgi:hypothetical protein
MPPEVRDDAAVAELTGLLRQSTSGDRLKGWPKDMRILTVVLLAAGSSELTEVGPSADRYEHDAVPRMMRCMKSRMTLSLDKRTADYISRKAEESGANVSAYVERHFRDQALRESVAKHVEWLKANPSFFEDMEAERDAAAGAA